MRYDAIVLAGGRSRRLDGVPKEGLLVAGQTLLQHALAAVRGARQTVVVGPEPAGGLPPSVLQTREDPPFASPAAGVAAGLEALGRPASSKPPDGHRAKRDSVPARPATRVPSPWVLVLACDMPAADAAVAALVAALAGDALADDAPTGEAASDGMIAQDPSGHLQPLAALYRVAALRTAIEAKRAAGSLVGSSMFSLVRPLHLAAIPVPAGSTDDVDTWEDARRLGVRSATPHTMPSTTSLPGASGPAPPEAHEATAPSQRPTQGEESNR
ncbi:MAG TPA: NTP transferase domain-containing protein [Microbacteriaceae bacterium]|nr:NTP transferase domain-containing protein [Microbacteriaceae bacterium]